MIIKTPAKIIISGEHSVVHGAPAIACALPSYFISTNINEHNTKDNVIINLNDYAISEPLSKDYLIGRKNKIENKYQQFLDKEIEVSQILSNPIDLAIYVIGTFLERYCSSYHGFRITVNSNVPSGCGMGSSAAFIIGVLKSLIYHFKINVTDDEFFKLAFKAENIRHGKSSGLDIKAILSNKAIYVNDGKQSDLDLEIDDFGIEIINNGKPKSTTGQCVMHAGTFFQKNPNLVNDFTKVTNDIYNALIAKDQKSLKEAIRKNHYLLSQIGVVPQDVQKIIKDIEDKGGAAKICGAGSVEGDRGGIIMKIK
jgi:mevalonate kinase